MLEILWNIALKIMGERSTDVSVGINGDLLGINVPPLFLASAPGELFIVNC